MSALIDAKLERAFLGACIAEPPFLHQAGVMPHELTTAARARILGAMLSLAATGSAVDTLSVRTELVRRGFAEGCDEELLAVTNELVVPADWMPKRIRELSRAREARERAIRAVAAYDTGRLDEAAAEMRQAIGALDAEDDDDRSVSIGQLVETAAERAKKREERVSQGKPVAITTGLASLDLLLGDAPLGEEAISGGWEAGDYVVLGGDTNVGKSSIAMAMAWGAARSEAPVPVGIVQIEDPRDRVGNRALSMAAEVPQHLIRGGRMTPAQWVKVATAVKASRDVPIHFEFRIGASLPAVCTAMRRLRREHGCMVIIVDYLQAVETHEDPRLAMRNIVAATKREAHRGEGAASVVVGLSQFRKRQDETEKPTRDHLYESAYLAQKAEHIVLAWKSTSGAINVVLDKTKDGKTGRQFALMRDPDTGLLNDADVVLNKHRAEGY